MRYTVAWTDEALGHLARVWTAAADRAAVNRTVDDIDAQLSTDPDLKGQDYFGDRYLMPPEMWVLYRVYPDDRTVYVLQVGRPGIDLPHEHQP
jgi:hypothetical protein